jgi:hypothetical protein
MIYEGSCHCGNIAFEVEGEFTEALDCNCSFCSRRGGLLGFVPRDSLRLKTPEENISTYTFNSHRIKHRFCANCGIGPFAEATGPDGTPMAAVNLRCLPAIDLASLKMKHHDGRSA